MSNCNFRAPDAFRLCVTTSGLEEVRAILRYQLMQKHLLIVATRVNQLMMDNCCKALSEVKLLEPERAEDKLCLPNSTLQIAEAFQKNADQISAANLRSIRQKFSQNLTSQVASVFFNVAEKKNKLRINIAKEYQSYQNKVKKNDEFHVPQCVQRVMRSFKVK